jgi:hypothetical protein
VSVVVSEKLKSRAILECYRRAAEARRMADAASNLLEKTDFLEIEKMWLSLAHSPEFWSAKILDNGRNPFSF